MHCDIIKMVLVDKLLYCRVPTWHVQYSKLINKLCRYLQVARPGTIVLIEATAPFAGAPRVVSGVRL